MKSEFKFNSTDDFGLLLKYCGVEYSEPKFMMNPHRREDFLLHYVFQGNGFFRCRDKDFPLTIGSVFIIFPQEVTSYGAYSGDPFNFCWMGFSGKNAEHLVELIGFSIQDPVLNLDPRNDILKLITRCVQLCKSPVPYSDLEIQSILFKIFNIIGTRQNCSQQSCHQIDNASSSLPSISLRDYISRTKNYIQLNYMKPLTVKELAYKISLDRTYLSKIFHRVEGMTVHDYLKGYRLETAKRLLLETTYNIQEISNLVGIPDSYYFSRLFKKYAGLSPTQYRRDRQTESKLSPLIKVGIFDELHFSENNLLLP